MRPTGESTRTSLGPSPALIVVSLFGAISPACARIQLRHRFTFWFSSISGARGRPLLGPSPALIIVSVSTPPLHYFFQGKCCTYPFGKKKGLLDIHFAPFVLYKSHLTILLIQKIVKM
jgi:hypothetical protein